MRQVSILPLGGQTTGMGISTFYVPQPERLPEVAVRQCFMQGIEAIPWRSRNTFENQQLRLQKETGESGQLIVPWHVAGRGKLALSTTCLRESPTPYHLPVELARGTVGRLRNQVAMWSHQGFQYTNEVNQRLQEAFSALGRAATSQHDPIAASIDAEAAIQDSLDTIDLLIRSYSERVLEQTGKRNVFLGANIGSHAGHGLPGGIVGAMNTAVVPLGWSTLETMGEQAAIETFAEQIRWCRRLGMRVCGGPLLDFQRQGFPDWLYLWEDDPDALQSYMLKHVETVVRNFSGQVNLWHAWGRINCGSAMPLSEEFRLRMAVGAIEVLRSIDPHTPVFVSFDQPWGEYLSRQSLDLAPIHYADTIARADLGISGFGLELNMGYWPSGSLPRDLLELNRLIDRWCNLGLPLVLILTIPSNSSSSNEQEHVLPVGAEMCSPETQARVADEFIRTALARPAVQGIIWNQLIDGDTPIFPHGGIYDEQKQAKPLLDCLTKINQELIS